VVKPVQSYRTTIIVSVAAAFLLTAGAGSTFAYFKYRDVVIKNQALEKRAGILEEIVRASNESLASSTLTNEELLARKNELEQGLLSEKSRNDAIQNQVNQITGAVGTLTKLSQTDKELLQKYSKVYFLNENYIPDSLTTIDPLFVFNKEKEIQIHTKVQPFLHNMIAEAGRAGINLRVVSGYRSFEDQMAVKSGYKVLYGSGANAFSADQGYSEHQLGTAVDMTTPALNGSLTTAFEKDKAYAWLKDNAYRYGFILSYPKGNVFYQFEPWHWRFVGTVLARDLHVLQKNFYDMPQRDINAYLIAIFD
jgi:LAS superfamily LD-carboxypeptidase LdcB